MKKSIRISSVILLTTLYCFSIGIGTKSLIYSDVQTTSQEKYFLTIPSLLSLHTFQSDSSVNIFNNFSIPSCKNLFDGLWTNLKITEQFYETVFSQYTSFSINFLIHDRKADIIFPFHYFW